MRSPELEWGRRKKRCRLLSRGETWRAERRTPPREEGAVAGVGMRGEGPGPCHKATGLLAFLLPGRARLAKNGSEWPTGWGEGGEAHAGGQSGCPGGGPGSSQAPAPVNSLPGRETSCRGASRAGEEGVEVVSQTFLPSGLVPGHREPSWEGRGPPGGRVRPRAPAGRSAEA